MTNPAFTIEPGICLPGWGGVRIEDNVVITANGNDCLTNFDRALRVIGTQADSPVCISMAW